MAELRLISVVNLSAVDAQFAGNALSAGIAQSDCARLKDVIRYAGQLTDAMMIVQERMPTG